MAFVSRILVPETARLFIMDDMYISDEEALSVLYNSQEFGAVLHPGDIEWWQLSPTMRLYTGMGCS